jgi:Fe-S-cluster containining protein
MTASISTKIDPTVCERCAEKYDTCCHADPQDIELCFPLSDTEWAKVKAAAPEVLGANDVANTPEFIKTLKRLFPHDGLKIDTQFPANETHRVLQSNEKGYCVYLTEQGCRLPREARPWFCLLFPFWVRGNELTMFTAQGCLVCRETDTVEESLELLGMDKPQVRELFALLRSSWGFDKGE